MPKVFWFDEARSAFDALPSNAQREIRERLERLKRFPELYARVEEGRFRGTRRFVVLQRFTVYYRVIGPNQDCYIRAIRPARGRAE